MTVASASPSDDAADPSGVQVITFPDPLAHKLLLTVESAAEVLSVSRDLIYRLMNEGQLRSIQVHGRARRIPRRELEAYIARQVAEADPLGSE